jgi:mannan endo-1,4-beta-mannosidase
MRHKKKFKINICVILLSLVFISCNERDKKPEMVDQNATAETKALLQNLHTMSGEHALFGHQATLAYGYTWAGDSSRSDVKDVTGSFPALYGWDVRDFISGPNPDKSNRDSLKWNRQLNYTKEGLKRGGVITYCWHMSNPATGGSFYDTTRAVHTIIPGGENHDQYKKTLDEVAAFFGELSPMPVIFRPFHEHNGDWFWWGKGLTTDEDYITLWRFTVDYLRDEKRVHNLLWAFSPDRSRTNIDTFKKDYFYGYPGDEYVDIIGLDNYWDVGHPANETPKNIRQEHFVRSLSMTAEIADSLGKVSALTETGLEAIPDPTFWTETMLKAMTANDFTQKVVYVQVWRNANYERENRDHYYAPYPGQVSAQDFIEFKDSNHILFETELPDMYSMEATE